MKYLVYSEEEGRIISTSDKKPDKAPSGCRVIERAETTRVILDRIEARQMDILDRLAKLEKKK